MAKQSDDTDPKEKNNGEAKNNPKTVTRYRLVKRLAVTTAQRTYSGHVLELLHTTDGETILAVLTRKVQSMRVHELISEHVTHSLSNQILRTALDDSIQDAQLLLQDWLTMALYHYNNLSDRGAHSTLITFN